MAQALPRPPSRPLRTTRLCSRGNGTVLTPKEKAPGLKPPVVFGARAYNLDRYMAHPKFSDLGFHPFRDNEEYYNDGRTTRFQNGRRTFNAYWDMFFSFPLLVA